MKHMKFYKDIFVGIVVVIGLLFVIKMIQESQEELKYEVDGDDNPIGV